MGLLEFSRSRRGGELIGIIVLMVGVILGAALVTYHSDDASAFHTSTNTVVANAIGYYGATIAWVFVSFFGFASLLFPAALLVAGWNRLWGREIEFLQTKLIGFTILTIASPPLLDLALGKVWVRGALLPSGGYLGSEINRIASGNLNSGGAAIVLVTAILVGFLLATRISLAAILRAIHEKIAALGRNFSMHWARFTERRRREKMKGAIVRKHLNPGEGTGETPALRLVPSTTERDAILPGPVSPIVREVQGAGHFQIRKVTKADLRKAAEELSKQESHDPFELYVETASGVRRAASGNGPAPAAKSPSPVPPPSRRPPPPARLVPEPIDDDETKLSVSMMSRRVMSSRLRFGTSMPTVDEPLMRSMRIDSAFRASARSSPRFTTFAYFTPADGLNSKVVTTGPGW